MTRNKKICAKCQTNGAYYRKPNEEDLYCGFCKTSDMINTGIKVCTKQGCTSPGYYAFPWGHKKFVRCLQHAIRFKSKDGKLYETMLINRRVPCAYRIRSMVRCGERAVFGSDGSNKPNRCRKHKHSNSTPNLSTIYTSRYVQNALGMPVSDKPSALKKVILIELLSSYGISSSCC